MYDEMREAKIGKYNNYNLALVHLVMTTDKACYSQLSSSSSRLPWTLTTSKSPGERLQMNYFITSQCNGLKIVEMSFSRPSERFRKYSR